MPRSSRAGAVVAFTSGFVPRWRRTEWAPPPSPLLLAELPVDAVADLALLQEAVLEEELVVLLRDPDGLQQDRLRPADGSVHARDLLALDDRDCRCGSRVCLQANRLVDGAALPAGQDELDSGRRRVLTRDRDRFEAVRLQGGDHGSGQTVVGRDRRIDVVPVAGEHLVEDLAT